jgi:hypothetical protein
MKYYTWQRKPKYRKKQEITAGEKSSPEKTPTKITTKYSQKH